MSLTQVPLAEVCNIVGGGTPRRSNAAYFNGAIPWATPTDVTALDSLFIERTKEGISEIGLSESSARLLPAGTVLMTSRATIGYTAIATQPMATNQGFANLICSGRILPEYLAYWLRNQRERLIQLAGGTTFRELPKSTLKKVCIPLPPLDEQRRIVGILNRAARIERLRNQAQELMREFIPALFVKMFGDPATNPMEWNLYPFLDLVSDGTKKCIKIQKRDYRFHGLVQIIDQGRSQVGGYTDRAEGAFDGPFPSVVFGDHTRRFKLIEEPFFWRVSP